MDNKTLERKYRQAVSRANDLAEANAQLLQVLDELKRSSYDIEDEINDLLIDVGYNIGEEDE